jgi:hypothetical protein
MQAGAWLGNAGSTGSAPSRTTPRGRPSAPAARVSTHAPAQPPAPQRYGVSVGPAPARAHRLGTVVTPIPRQPPPPSQPAASVLTAVAVVTAAGHPSSVLLLTDVAPAASVLTVARRRAQQLQRRERALRVAPAPASTIEPPCTRLAARAGAALRLEHALAAEAEQRNMTTLLFGCTSSHARHSCRFPVAVPAARVGVC